MTPMVHFSLWLYRLSGWRRMALMLIVLVPLWGLVAWALKGVS